MAFHEVRFPTDISFGARGGPRRKTIIAVSGSGYEHRNSQWADSKRDYNAGYGVKDMDDIHTVVAFFEERRGVAGECFAMLAAAEVLDEDGGGGARIERADFDGVDERGAGAPFGFGLVERQEFDREPGGEQRMGDE